MHVEKHEKSQMRMSDYLRRSELSCVLIRHSSTYQSLSKQPSRNYTSDLELLFKNRFLLTFLNNKTNLFRTEVTVINVPLSINLQLEKGNKYRREISFCLERERESQRVTGSGRGWLPIREEKLIQFFPFLYLLRYNAVVWPF